ncbi:MAG: DUF1446 domain-containing protein, partial [Planctomycetaceae bacterium]|nr:DUF1446 domain-containing protein [Planctomycetaceae bacterium]
RTSAAAEMLAYEPDLDYLTLDYLAEVSMSILAVQRDRDPAAGYARDFIDVIRSLGPYWAGGGRCRLITNAGGLNPQGCADACRAELEVAGCGSLKVAIVTGDDVLSLLRQSVGSLHDLELLRNLDTNAPIETAIDRLLTANAYVGAAPIIEALAQGADIVITGRTADPSLAVAACVQHFGWAADDWSRLAGATVAGHLIECGTHVTGGISTDWLSVPELATIGFPLVEVAADGSCIVTKPRGSGGRVTEQTVKEQLLYEIGDPTRYLSPDATVSFLSLQVTDLGENRVRVTGAVGSPPPSTLKVSATYRDGYRAAGTLTIFGRDAVVKAQRVGEIVLQRVMAAGHSLRDYVVECLGGGESVAGVIPSRTSSEVGEIVLRIGVEADTRAAVECFSRELMPLVTAGPQGVCGYAEGRPHVQPVIRYWPCLIERNAIVSRVSLITTSPDERRVTERPHADQIPSAVKVSSSAAKDVTESRAELIRPVSLYDIAYARSGDKGNSANVGLIARAADDYGRLRRWLTADRVAEFFQPLDIEGVERYELPNLNALNFVIRGVLRRRLRNDAQGKTLGQALLEMPLDDDYAESGE